MKEKLFDSEAKIMKIIWDNSPISAKEISLIAAGSGTYRLHVVATVTGTDGGSEEVSAYSSEVKA